LFYDVGPIDVAPAGAILTPLVRQEAHPCIQTNKPVPTGLTMDVEAFSMEAFDAYFLHSPIVGSRMRGRK
jgi:hypothetical protein